MVEDGYLRHRKSEATNEPLSSVGSRSEARAKRGPINTKADPEVTDVPRSEGTVPTVYSR